MPEEPVRKCDRHATGKKRAVWDAGGVSVESQEACHACRSRPGGMPAEPARKYGGHATQAEASYVGCRKRAGEEARQYLNEA